MSTSIVIGMAEGYDWGVLSPFVVSLRRSGYIGRLLLINAQIPPEQIAEYGIEICSYPDSDLLTEQESGTEPICEANAEHRLSAARFRLIPEIAAEYDFDWCILVDTKDIIFQSNPVQWLDSYAAKSGIVVAEEMNVYKTCWGARVCAQQAFGEAAYQSIKDCTVLNAGFIAGKPEPITQLCKDIVPILEKMCQDCLPQTDLHGDIACSNETYEQQLLLLDQTAMNIILRQPEWTKTCLVKMVKPGDGSFIARNRPAQATRVSDLG